MSIMIRCGGCRFTATVNRVTPGLRCTCGSTDLDLYSPGRESFLEHMGAAHGPGTGWGSSMPDPLKGWNAYEGPMPGPNPRGPSERHGPFGCETCKGSKVDVKDGGTCRACQGTGHRTSPTAVSPEPLVARHPGQTTTPFMGRRKKTARKRPTRRQQATAMLRAVQQQNPGLDRREAEGIVRYTMKHYGE